MILCVTLNPCLDKTLLVPEWNPGDLVRSFSVREVVGGKGNNVARALKRLGQQDVTPLTFLGGQVGKQCGELLAGEGLDPLVVQTHAKTREILTVRTQNSVEQTAFFDPDPAISPDEAQAMIDAVDSQLSSKSVRALTLSGSSPSATTHGLYSELIALAQARTIPTFLDTYGPSLAAIWGFWPTVIQLNLREAAIHLGTPKRRPTDEDVLALLERWSKRGVEVAVVTDGPNRFHARVNDEIYRITPPTIEPVNPIGSGDCFLAGLVSSSISNLASIEMLKHATASAVANTLVWDAGAIDVSMVAQIAESVLVERLA